MKETAHFASIEAKMPLRLELRLNLSLTTVPATLKV